MCILELSHVFTEGCVARSKTKGKASRIDVETIKGPHTCHERPRCAEPAPGTRMGRVNWILVKLRGVFFMWSMALLLSHNINQNHTRQRTPRTPVTTHANTCHRPSLSHSFSLDSLLPSLMTSCLKPGEGQSARIAAPSADSVPKPHGAR